MNTWTVGGRTFHFRCWPDMAWRIAVAALALLVVAGSVVALTRADAGDDEASTVSETASSSEFSSTTGAQEQRALDDSAAGPRAATGGAGGDVAPTGEQKFSRDVQSTGGGSTVPAFSPKIIRSADLRVRVRGSFTAAVDRANAVAGSLGGFVTSSSTSSFERGKASAELTLRVPADAFDEARRRLSSLGKLESLEMSGRDVGGQLVDLDARLRALRAEEGALQLLLGRAGDIGQILQVRDRLTFVRTEIEQLGGQQAALQDQVAMSTLHISLHEAGASIRSEVEKERNETGIAASAGDAIDVAEAVVGGMLIVVGALSPLLAAALLAWFVYWLIVRRRRLAPTG